VEGERSKLPETLDGLELGDEAIIAKVRGARPFRRRLMEMGLVPGTEIKLVNIAPLGDPLEIELRGSRLSIRRREAVEVYLR
jgi:ferrous iron transport protein A